MAQHAQPPHGPSVPPSPASTAGSTAGSSASGGVVDDSLATLMRLLTLEYASPADVEPRWKRFARDKRRDLAWIEKKRLDNAIWRAWNLWRLRGRKTPFFDFERALREATGGGGGARGGAPEAGARGGEQWQRHLEAVKAEYKEWRTWYMQQVARKKKRNASDTAPQAPPRPALTSGAVQLGSFSDTLFSSLDAHGHPHLEALRDIDEPMTVDVAQPSLSHTLGAGASGVELPSFAPDSWIHVGVPQELLRGIFREAGVGGGERPRPGLVPLLPAATAPNFNPFAHPSTLGVLGHVPSMAPLGPLGLQTLLPPATPGDGLADGRRTGHSAAEQKRRNHIRSGFDDLQAVIPGCQLRLPGQKFSKATVLQRAIEFIGQLTRQRALLDDEANRARREICALKLGINQYQQHLAALDDTPTPTPDNSGDATAALYREYVQRRSAQDPKFWIFSTIADQLFATYNQLVGTGGLDVLTTSAFAWVEGHCQLPTLRECAVRSLRALASFLFPGAPGAALIGGGASSGMFG